MGKTEDYIKEQIGKQVEKRLSNIKLKTFNSITIKLDDLKLKAPKVSIANNNFKIKAINTDTGEAISDIPLDIQFECDTPVITASFSPMKLTPKLDLRLGKRNARNSK